MYGSLSDAEAADAADVAVVVAPERRGDDDTADTGDVALLEVVGTEAERRAARRLSQAHLPRWRRLANVATLPARVVGSVLKVTARESQTSY